MSTWPNYPAIYELNTAVWLNELSRNCKQRVTLANVPEAELERLADRHFDAVWLMGIWKRSQAARRIAQTHISLQSDYERILPDYQPEDVVGSPYAIYDFSVDDDFGGNKELAILRHRLQTFGLRLILDFVSNHLALDHPWVINHPERLVRGDEASIAAAPGNYFRSGTAAQPLIFAHGRASRSEAWTDTVQLDYRPRETRHAMSDILLAIAEQCDGIRCDMAMLITHDVFRNKWGGEFDPPGTEFWPAAINNVKSRYPDFLMLAEVYWDLEYALQQQGFDYTYDKPLYDRLLNNDVSSINAHLRASLEYQRHLVRFIENHDERRALEVFGLNRSKASATIALTAPGLRLLHDGQIEGRRLRQPVQLVRRPAESPDRHLESFYRALLNSLAIPVFHLGNWRLLQGQEAWGGNNSYRNFVAYCWLLGDERRLVVVNMSPNPSQCYLPLGIAPLAGCSWYLNDTLSDAKYVRDGDELIAPGLYLDMPGYSYHLFQLQLRSKKIPPGFKLRCTFQENRNRIYGMTWSPDGRMLALSGDGTAIWLLNSEDCGSVRRLEGHTDVIGAVAWSPNGRLLASGSNDKMVRLWEVRGAVCKVLKGHVNDVLTVAWSPNSGMLASGSADRTTILWDVNRGELIEEFGEHSDAVNCVAWSPDGKVLASGSGDQTIRLRDIKAGTQRVLKGRDWVSSIAWSPNGKVLASATGGSAIDIWDVETGHHIAVREGHAERVLGVAFSPDGRLLVSKSYDNSVRFWRCDNWEEIATLEESGECLSGISFHPTRPILATRDDRENVVRLWDLDLDQIFNAASTKRAVHYTNARVVLVGESGIGKSCLARALMGLPFQPQQPNQGISICTLSSEKTMQPNGGEITREIVLWDLPGQADYRIVHQLFLDEAALAIVLFEPTHPDNPFSGVGHWEKVLRRAVGEDCPRLLVASRADRGYPSISETQTKEFCRKHGFQGFIATSACTKQGIEELRAAIMRLIPWDSLPVTSSPDTWEQIRTYLIDRSSGSRVLTPLSELRDEFRARHPGLAFTDSEFDTVITQAQVQGLVWRFSFGDLVLLKPELLKNYASAVVRVAREDPNGLGSIKEQSLLEGAIDFQDMSRLPNSIDEQSLLHAVVELFLKKEIALREVRGEDEHLVFPSKLNRDRPEFPKLPRPEVVYRFSGLVEAIHATLVVRLFHCGAFRLKKLWKDTAEFSDSLGKACGFVLRSIEEDRGVISVFFDEAASMDNKLLFEKFIQRHLETQVLSCSSREPTYRCPSCDEEVDNQRAIQDRRAKGLATITCQFCEGSIALVDSREALLSDRDLLVRVESLERQAQNGIDEDVRKLVSERKKEIGEFDVFLSYNSKDEDSVEQIAKALKRRQLHPWFAMRDLKAPELWLKRISQIILQVKSAVIFIGQNGLSDWQTLELTTLISRSVEKKVSLIPVLLPGVEKIPEDLFLCNFQMVRFSKGVNDPKALDSLTQSIRASLHN